MSLTVLQVAQGYPPTDYAGVELVTHELAHMLADAGHRVGVFCREGNRSKAEYAVTRFSDGSVDVLRVVNNFTRFAEPDVPYYHPEIERLFADYLEEVRPDVVHFQHLAGASYRLPDIVRRAGIPVVFTLHDYWYVCPRFHLLNREGAICAGPDKGETCRECLRWVPMNYVPAPVRRLVDRLPPTARAVVGQLWWQVRKIRHAHAAQPHIEKRFERLLGCLVEADALVAVSHFARDLYIANGVPPDKITVIPNGFSPRPAPPAPKQDPVPPLRVGFLGSVMPHKGVHVLVQAVKGLPAQLVSLRVHGTVGDRLYARRLAKIAPPDRRSQVQLCGGYEPSQLPEVLAGLDVVAIPSMWHETFNLVLREAWWSGATVVASRVGAITEAVRHEENGLLVPPGDVGALRAALRRLAEDPELLAGLKARRPGDYFSIKDNGRAYLSLYRQALARHGKPFTGKA